MKIKDLIDSYDAITPTQEKKEKMLTEILNAKDRKAVGYFNFKRAGLAVAGLAAAIALAVSVYSFVDLDAPSGSTYVAQVTDGVKEEKQDLNKSEKINSPKTEKKADVKASAKKTEVAMAKPEETGKIAEAAIETEPQPRVSGGGSSGAMGRSIDQNTEDEMTDNSGIAMVSEEIYDAEAETETTEKGNKGGSGMAVVSEKDMENEIEWITMPSLEEVPELEENSVLEGSTKDENEDEEEAENQEEK